MMDSIFGNLIRSDKIIVYLGNILIFSDDLEEHYNTTMEVLRQLWKHKLMLKAEKCKFDQTTIDFLGVVVGNGQVSMDLEKTKAVREWRTPCNLKESRSFMQFCNYYRTIIPNFAAVTVPLNDLTCKDTPFVWGDRQQAAFDALKKAIADNVVLMLPVPGAKFRVETDTSNYAVGAVLHQIIDGKAHPLAFLSKTLLPEQRRYHVHDQELLAIVLTLQHFRHFLQNGWEFDIWTDHKNLQYSENRRSSMDDKHGGQQISQNMTSTCTTGLAASTSWSTRSRARTSLKGGGVETAIQSFYHRLVLLTCVGCPSATKKRYLRRYAGTARRSTTRSLSDSRTTGPKTTRIPMASSRTRASSASRITSSSENACSTRTTTCP